MNKNEIINNFNTAHLKFWDTAIHLPNTNLSINGKWSVAHNVEHINIILLRVNNYLSLPKSTIKSNFGLSERTVESNETVVEMYKNKLENGTKATAPFIPELNLDKNIKELVSQGNELLVSIISNLQDWTEEELEIYNCPHPLLGIIPAREILYFTIYHVQHHNETIKNNFI
ncbi:DinB family protein [Flavobacterium sp. ZT3R18]|uniref:DinB family protein n=1 Tax=Flavobacterium sp. ZT3R18 TaxID=2594429 RepID=UPI00117A2BB0|nr:DinB family protein [Flavobacterium sp. ZT3R18]TRX37235.1 DinB family protein [Flavobacterium sp. ZT3R18]